MKYSESLAPFFAVVLKQGPSSSDTYTILAHVEIEKQLEKPSVIKSRTSKFFSKHGAQDGNSNNLNHPRLFGVPFWQFPAPGHGKPTVIIYLFIYL